MADHLVSICIPTFKKPDYVSRCLESIQNQNYKNIEIIVSDDSPDEGIKEVIKRFSDLTIRFIHNKPPLKSPKNWNAALDKAEGEFIMLLHQDDWLTTDYSISRFVESFKDKNIDFAFCKNIGVNTEGKVIPFQDKDEIPDLMQRPNYLIIRCVIGPPSNVMFRKRVKIRYDEHLIWLVDVDYYIGILKAKHTFHYIKEQLVTIGIHADQTTEHVRANNKIIFKENIYVLKKLEEDALFDLQLFDYYWRLIRNFKITSIEQLQSFDIITNVLPGALKEMISVQKKHSSAMLKNGFFSKSLMFVTYLNWRFLKRR